MIEMHRFSRLGKAWHGTAFREQYMDIITLKYFDSLKISIMGKMTILSKSSNNNYSYTDSTDGKLTANVKFELSDHPTDYEE